MIRKKRSLCPVAKDGKSTSLVVPLLSKTDDLKLLAQKALGHRCLKLVQKVLSWCSAETLEAGLQDGDQLTAMACQPKRQHSSSGPLLSGGGGRSKSRWQQQISVRDQVRGVQQMQSTEAAVAAVLQNGSAITWGKADFGSDSSAVQDQLKAVEKV